MFNLGVKKFVLNGFVLNEFVLKTFVLIGFVLETFVLNNRSPQNMQSTYLVGTPFKFGIIIDGIFPRTDDCIICEFYFVTLIREILQSKI